MNHYSIKKMSLEFLTGKFLDDFVPYQSSSFLVHKEMITNLELMVKKAKNDGLELALTSSFRSYEIQKKIWNEKASGIRTVLDADSKTVDLSKKSLEDILFLILKWSAIPGGSRHHWGTDIDVYDKNALPENYKVQLIPSEYEPGGMFNKLNHWLDENMSDFGFFKPYTRSNFSDRSGIAPEPWHISYRPLSEEFLKVFSFDLFEEHLNQSDFLLISEAKEYKKLIYDRYIKIE